MTWIAILWITGCSGLHCDPMVASTITQPNEETCQRVIKTWRDIKENHRAVCMHGDLDKLNVIIDDTEKIFRAIAGDKS